ncbi:hypothetical protein G7046_g355 [Stylonectria norvegica]|nr:hypothetical protein G7046_g355 [Stylonectria norvegica]
MSGTLDESSGKRSNSRSHSRTSRPTTPLRPSSRSSFRDSARSAGDGDAPFPLNTFEPAFAELSDAMADLEANMMHFQLMHESLARFSESFASFLTTDTSFVENPPTASRTSSKFATPETRQSRVPATRGTSSRGTSNPRGTRGRPSGLARARPRGGSVR